MGRLASYQLVRRFAYYISAVLIISAALIFVNAPTSRAIVQLPEPDPKPGSFGLEATKKQPPPTTVPTIAAPGNNSSSNQPTVTVNGICQTGLLIEVLNNGVMAGSTMCKNGSFSLVVSLFVGDNRLTAVGYDDLGQPSPTSRAVTVSFNPPNTMAFGDIVTLTSTYGRRAAKVGNNLTWPLQLSGGTGPYAFSIDWGDGSDPQLKSQALAGNVMIEHKYEHAGIYTVTISVTDSNDVTAFLQTVAVSSGLDGADNTTSSEIETKPKVVVLWVPAVLTMLMLIPAYWLGRRSQLTSLRRQLERDRDAYSKK